VQTVDIGPTLLEFFGVPSTPDMQGRSLLDTARDDTPARVAGMFGIFGGHVSVTDGRYVYMRASADPSDAPLYEHTLMPSHMNDRFSVGELADAELAEPFSFTKGLRTLRLAGIPFGSSWSFGTLLFDMVEDPQQLRPIRDDALELRMTQLLVEQMRASDAPESQFVRLGLPRHGEVTADHLLVAAQWERVTSAHPVLNRSRLDGDSPLLQPIGELMADPGSALVLKKHLGERGFVTDMRLSLWQFSVMFPALVTRDTLLSLQAELRQVGRDASELVHP
jgi:hypothetical protein